MQKLTGKETPISSLIKDPVFSQYLPNFFDKINQNPKIFNQVAYF